MYPTTLTWALKALSLGLHAKKREALEIIKAHLLSYHDGLSDLVGPGHIPPTKIKMQSLKVARPAIQAAYWTDGPWHCLRIEERTVGHERPRAWFNSATGRPDIRNAPVTEQWMTWVQKILKELRVKPLKGSVRLVFFPGLAYTFTAWRKVDQRDEKRLHPMDPDNSSKSTTDALMVPKPEKPKKPNEDETPLKIQKLVAPKKVILSGAYFDDAQIVDLLVFRLPQDGAPPVDRITIRKTRKAKAKKKKTEKLAQDQPKAG